MEKVPKTISSKGDVDHDIGSEESPLLADDTIKIPLDEEQVLSEAAPSDDVDATMEESEVVAINDVVVTHDEKRAINNAIELLLREQTISVVLPNKFIAEDKPKVVTNNEVVDTPNEETPNEEKNVDE